MDVEVVGVMVLQGGGGGVKLLVGKVSSNTSERKDDGGAEEDLALVGPGAALELLLVVDVGEGAVGNGDFEELAEGLPAVLDRELEEVLGGNDPADLLDVLLVNADGIALVVEAVVEGSLPDDLLGHGGEAGDLGEKDGDKKTRMRVKVDGVEGAVVPRLGITRRQDDLGVGVEGKKLLVVLDGGPVDGGVVVLEEDVQVDVLSVSEVRPLLKVTRVVGNLDHVVARAKTKLFEGNLEGHRSRAAETGSDDERLLLND